MRICKMVAALWFALASVPMRVFATLVLLFSALTSIGNAAQLIPVSVYSREMNGTQYTSGGASDLGGTSSNMFKIGITSTSVRVLFANYLASAESSTQSTLTIQASIQTTADTGTPIPLTFNGASSLSLASGAIAYSDPIAGTFTAGQYVSVLTYVQVPASGKFPTGPFTTLGNSAITGYSGSAGNNYAQNNSGAGTNQTATAGSASAWVSSSTTPGFGPLSLDGYAMDGNNRPIVVGVGDSIFQGTADSILNATIATDSTGGAFVRSMIAMGAPYYLTAKYGETLATVYSGTLNAFVERNRRQQRATVIEEEYGTNDLNNSATFATIRTEKLALWNLLASNGAQIIPVTTLPRQSNAHCPASGQVLNGNLSAYEAVNAWYRAPAYAGIGNSAIADAAAEGVTIPGIIDAAALFETNSSNATPSLTSPYTAGYIYCGANNATTLTVEGVHPTTAGALQILPAFMAAQNMIFATAPLQSPTSSIFFQGH